ncbi:MULTISPECIES: hypothetical protein [Streptomyces]|uniref:hypothetical protein n=1 Tax=Streptomyces TaxID=1883 RepID=UPI00210A882A|nr:hypothetical protein [Streptomyces longispororuber]MCQ4214509.1 hypothetical protein [Streptomyces longispororuber]
MNLPLTTAAALLALTLFAAVLLPAVWSRSAARRRAAERIVRILVDAFRPNRRR